MASSLTIGCGGLGGVFGPSMVVGGAIGGAVGFGLESLVPDLVPHPGAYVLVGMAGFFAGAAHTPISTIIMVSEMTGNYELLLPSMWVTTIAFIMLYKTGVYENQLANARHSPAHRGDFFHDVLAGMRVRDVPSTGGSFICFDQSANLGEILHKIDKTHQNYFPVLAQDGDMVRIFSLNDVRPYFYEEKRWGGVQARDLGTDDIVSVVENDTLSRAIRRLTERNIEAIPVVEADNRKRVIRFLRRKQLIDEYNRKVQTLEEG